MKGKNVIFSSNSDEWETPQELFEQLNREFNFTLDACATENNRKCEKYYSIKNDGLKANWGGGDSVLQSSVFQDWHMD